MALMYIDKAQVSLWWPSCQYFLKLGLQAGNDSCIEQLYASVEAGHTQLMVYTDEYGIVSASMTFYFNDLPNMRIVYVSALGGSSVVSNKQIWESFKSECRKYNVQAIRASCKSSQARLFRRLGFHTVYQQIELRL
jgi:hypothetical protein